MMIKSNIAMAVASALLCSAAFAAVSADEAKQLGATLTLFGAEKAGNKDGSIPEYIGAGVKTPSGYNKSKLGQKPDPWNEKPLFTITAQNMDQHADRLTDGQRALFKTYPNFRMDVYPSHRTATFPKYVLDNTVKNATACKATDNELVLQGCYGGFPFPIPKTGTQVMWNHLVGYETLSYDGTSSNWLVPKTGNPVFQGLSFVNQEFPYYDPKRTGTNTAKDLYWMVRTNDSAPPRRAGEKIVLLDALDQLNVGRRAYQYIPGQRRVKLAPDLSYDTPNPYTGGASTMDEAKSFAGAMDRYDWTLVGKKEKYIMYNAFPIHNASVCPDEKLIASKGFPNPDCIRWELHRVWIVSAKLKPGFRHVYPTRTFYWDEDGYLGGGNEDYDGSGKLYRITIGINMPYFDGAGQSLGGTFHLDLQTGLWAVNGAGTCSDPKCGTWPTDLKGIKNYSPEAMAGEGIR